MSQSRGKPPLRIGLTGGIASGKSLVADMFAELGVPVIDTDVIAREVVAPGTPALNEIRERFGDDAIGADGSLDRRAMRKTIFSDDRARLDLEAILHPRIGDETRRQARAADGDYQIIVVPLLVDSPLNEFIDRVLVVDCSEDTQIQRLLARDKESVEQARRMLATQTSRPDRLAIADDVIENDGALSATRRRVIELDQAYRQLASLRYPSERS